VRSLFPGTSVTLDITSNAGLADGLDGEQPGDSSELVGMATTPVCGTVEA